ncbi:MAG TPA: pantetheine-phosphate adenylyltransferase [Dehalococcoidia bacterium]|nr:pantetheine-phosphate adenylyltransferase [Dehalococcoidia bacterium]HLB28630.1 pantetheine-phosphate adenylyltransferase [Dehalococcoidia bacterium]
MTIAVYPGRFDPVTKGHLDITSRAASLFDTVLVAVLDLPREQTLFTTEERIAFFREAVLHLPNVEVKAFKGLLVAFAHQQGARVIVRGIRAVTDFEAEFDMALMNKKMTPEVESVYLMASLEHLFVSGRRIREVAGLGFDVEGLVPPHVAQALRQRFRTE